MYVYCVLRLPLAPWTVVLQASGIHKPLLCLIHVLMIKCQYGTLNVHQYNVMSTMSRLLLSWHQIARTLPQLWLKLSLLNWGMRKLFLFLNPDSRTLCKLLAVKTWLGSEVQVCYRISVLRVHWWVAAEAVRSSWNFNLYCLRSCDFLVFSCYFVRLKCILIASACTRRKGLV